MSEGSKVNVFVFLMPIIVMVILYTIYGKLEGSISATMLSSGGTPLQGMNWATLYHVLVWVLFFPTILLSFPIYYFVITKDKRTSLNLFIESIGLFVFAGVYQDWMVFVLSDTMTLTETGSVLENLLGSPVVNIFGHETPVYYFIFLAISIVLICYSMRDFWYRKIKTEIKT